MPTHLKIWQLTSIFRGLTHRIKRLRVFIVNYNGILSVFVCLFVCFYLSGYLTHFVFACVCVCVCANFLAFFSLSVCLSILLSICAICINQYWSRTIKPLLNPSRDLISPSSLSEDFSTVWCSLRRRSSCALSCDHSVIRFIRGSVASSKSSSMSPVTSSQSVLNPRRNRTYQRERGWHVRYRSKLFNI